MCPCKKKSIIEYLEGFFECIGSPQSGSIKNYYNIYGDLLTSLYQLDDDGNKVVIDLDTASNKFVIDANKPVYVGSLRDNSNSNFVTYGLGNSNSYNDIVNLGFKPANHEFLIDNLTLSSFKLDAAKDSVLPISYNKDSGECTFSSNVRALCLPKVNFYIYKKYDMNGFALPQFGGYYGIKREGYQKIGNYEYGLVYENTGAIDEYGNIIQRAKASVLMLPPRTVSEKRFKLLGHSDGNYGSEYDVEIAEYSLARLIVDYGQEVDARGLFELVHVNFVNADSNHADLIPTDSCQFLGKIINKVGSVFEEPMFGNKWDAECNDIYCNLNGKLSIAYDKKHYMDRSVDSYLSMTFLNGIYNTRFLSSNKSMYLYNVKNILNNISIKDSIDISVKRLPVINLTGRLLKSDFDSSKPYIYIMRDNSGDYGLLLCNYTDLDSDLVFQVTDHYGSGKYKMLTEPTGFTIFCSSTEPDSNYSCDKNGNVTNVYRLVCQPTEMNEEVQYELTKM